MALPASSTALVAALNVAHLAVCIAFNFSISTVSCEGGRARAAEDRGWGAGGWVEGFGLCWAGCATMTAGGYHRCSLLVRPFPYKLNINSDSGNNSLYNSIYRNIVDIAPLEFITAPLEFL